MKTIRGLLRSRTFWFNIISLILMTVNTIQPIITMNVFLIITAVCNILLRIITTESLTDKIKEIS